MTNLMRAALGADWDKLPPALQAHYRFGTATDSGHLDIEFPRFMQPFLAVLRRIGALVDRQGTHLPTVVAKHVVSGRQYWRRAIEFPDGRVAHFNTYWVSAGGGQIIEYVNPVLGLQMEPRVVNGDLHYEGVCFVARLGPALVTLPEWLVLGHTTIVEMAIDDAHFAMDFRLRHPLLGQVFRYSGTFMADVRGAS